ncbi:hypothetical protein PR048_024552 [Dryococelus australis]|uniref:Uncharacterized protein n=1 Tax=Dryococelus australis TaxID=614101 RepID=A0ABQ9GNW9_9NEOP|nr:hypothetical protein PR048_024552 [Dryococelus australis]
MPHARKHGVSDSIDYLKPNFISSNCFTQNNDALQHVGGEDWPKGRNTGSWKLKEWDRYLDEAKQLVSSAPIGLNRGKYEEVSLSNLAIGSTTDETRRNERIVKCKVVRVSWYNNTSEYPQVWILEYTLEWSGTSFGLDTSISKEKPTSRGAVCWCATSVVREAPGSNPGHMNNFMARHRLYNWTSRLCVTHWQGGQQGDRLWRAGDARSGVTVPLCSNASCCSGPWRLLPWRRLTRQARCEVTRAPGLRKGDDAGLRARKGGRGAASTEGRESNRGIFSRTSDKGDNHTHDQRPAAPTLKALNQCVVLPLLHFPVQMRCVTLYYDVGLEVAGAAYMQYINLALRKKRKRRRRCQTQLFELREHYAGSTLMADLRF